MIEKKFQPGDALLLVDIQNDFLPDGQLPVPEGDAIIPVVNQWIAAARAAKIPIFASQDWHPENHCSFKAQGGPWPVHCVRETIGAAFPATLKLPSLVTIIHKATLPGQDAYSAFQGEASDDTSLVEKLKALYIHRLWIAGLALDYCVKATALDAMQAGFAVLLIRDGTRAITEETGARALQELIAVGVEVV